MKSIRSPAPIKAMENDTFSMAFILCWKRTRTHLNATVRWTVAAEGLTEANLNETSPVTGTIPEAGLKVILAKSIYKHT